MVWRTVQRVNGRRAGNLCWATGIRLDGGGDIAPVNVGRHTCGLWSPHVEVLFPVVHSVIPFITTEHTAPPQPQRDTHTHTHSTIKKMKDGVGVCVTVCV